MKESASDSSVRKTSGSISGNSGMKTFFAIHRWKPNAAASPNALVQPAKPPDTGQRQLPQGALEPHGADHDAHEPDGQMRSCALCWVRLPIATRDPDAGEEEGSE